MARETGTLRRDIGDYFLDAIPTLLAGFLLLGPTLGLDGGPPGTPTRPFAMQGADSQTAMWSLILAVVGVLYGLMRAGSHGSSRLGLGVALCAFAGVLSFLQFV